MKNLLNEMLENFLNTDLASSLDPIYESSSHPGVSGRARKHDNPILFRFLGCSCLIWIERISIKVMKCEMSVENDSTDIQREITQNTIDACQIAQAGGVPGVAS